MPHVIICVAGSASEYDGWMRMSRLRGLLVADEANSTVQRRQVGAELRRARAEAGLTQQEAAEELKWSLSKLIRAEAGIHGISERDLRVALTRYGKTSPQRISELAAAARDSRRNSWWHDYRDVVSPQFAQLLGHEDLATSIRVCHPFLIPSLLQTEDYATDLMSFYRTQQKVRMAIKLRMERQERLRKNPGAKVVYVVGQEALHREIGGPGVMRIQLERLLNAGQDRDMTVRIVPFSAGTHPGLQGPFTLLKLTEPDEKLLFVESIGGDRFVRDEPQLIDEHERYLEMMTAKALSPEEGTALLEDQIGRLRDKETGAGRTERATYTP
jgi:DNA-binding XRE family transcriptional regulator